MLLKSTKACTNVDKNYFMHNVFSVWLLLYGGIWTCRVLRENTWPAETWESLLSSVSFKSAASPHWPGSRQLAGEGEASTSPGKAPAPGLVGRQSRRVSFPVRGRSALTLAVGFQRCHLCEGVDWIATGFDGVFVKVVSWPNSSLVKVEWEELMALCVSHLLSAFIGRNSWWRGHVFFPHAEASD